MREFFSNKQNIAITGAAIILILIGIIVGVSISTKTNATNTEVASAEEEPVNNKITLLALGVDKQVAMDERHPEPRGYF